MKKMPPSYYAFFDVDGTLIRDTTMLSFLKYYYVKRFSHLLGEVAFKLYTLKAKLFLTIGKTREFLNRNYYKNFENQKSGWIKEIGKEWFKNEIHNKNLYIRNIINEMIKHQMNGAEVVLVSGSFDALLGPFADQFNIKHILASTLEVENGKFTGSILPPQTIGNGKAEAIRRFLSQNEYRSYQDCFAYGDHHSDIQMLSLVGNPKVVSGDYQLEQHAITHGWEIIQHTN